MKQHTADCCSVPTVLQGMQWVVVALHLRRMVCIGLVLHLCSACTWASSEAAPRGPKCRCCATPIAARIYWRGVKL